MPELISPSEMLLPEGRKRWAIRAYLGIGEDGGLVEPMTQQEIADALGVSRVTVGKWVNEPPDFIEEMGLVERLTIYSVILTGNEEELDEYLRLVRHTDTRSTPLSELKRAADEVADDDLDLDVPEEGVEW